MRTKRNKKRTLRINAREKQIIRRKKISLVLQMSGILLLAIGTLVLLGSAGRADYNVAVGIDDSDTWMLTYWVSLGITIIGLISIMIPKKIFKMSMF